MCVGQTHKQAWHVENAWKRICEEEGRVDATICFRSAFVIFMLPRDSESALVFFFSRRRRHTRSDRDWSSDVCSSDLLRWGRRSSPRRWRRPRPHRSRTRLPSPPRSEERRVGKECRSRWSPYDEKKKNERKTENGEACYGNSEKTVPKSEKRRI